MYNALRADFYTRISQLPHGNLVLFQIHGLDTSSDSLVAAVPAADVPDTYCILGTLEKLPPSYEGIVTVDNWDNLYATTCDWVASMQLEADKFAVLPRYGSTDGSLAGNNHQWIWWSLVYSVYSTAKSLMFTVTLDILAPQHLVERTKNLGLRAALESALVDAVASVQACQQAVERAKLHESEAISRMHAVEKRLSEVKL